MTNEYLPDETPLAPGALARSDDVNSRYEATVSAFDKLPAPASGKKGFSDPVPVGTPTDDDHAATKVYVDENTSAGALAAAQAAQEGAEAAEANAGLESGYAQEWANKAEDSLVSAAAGGDEVDDYSAMHHATKAAAILAQFDPDTLLRQNNIFYGSYISGLVPSLAADTDHDITLSTGSCVDKTGAGIISLLAPLTKQLDATWVAGNGVGGMFSGVSLTADTTYHIHMIVKDSDGSNDWGYDTSLTAANKPAGYTAYRRVWSFKTDVSANIVPFSAIEAAGGGIRAYPLDIANVYNNTSPGTSKDDFSTTAPSGLDCIVAGLSVTAVKTDISNILLTGVDYTGTAPTVDKHTIRTGTTGANSSNFAEIHLDSSARAAIWSDVASGFVSLRVNMVYYDDYRTDVDSSSYQGGWLSGATPAVSVIYDATGYPDLYQANGDIHLFTATADTTFTIDMAAGSAMTLHLFDGDAHAITWPTLSWIGGAAPSTLTAEDVFEFWKVGSVIYAAYVGSPA